MKKLLTKNNPNYPKEYYAKNKTILQKKAKEYYIENREKILLNLKNKKKKPLTEAQKANEKVYHKKYYKEVLKSRRQDYKEALKLKLEKEYTKKALRALKNKNKCS